MKSNCKRLGDLINTVSVKNTDMITDDLRGVNYQKYFMPSVANTIGVDLSGYKVIKNGQFACNLMHVGRDKCLPVALHRDEKPIIVSPAYFSFEVKDESEILSEFLFLWFKRAEFDREACFYTDADVRQGLIKSSFFDMKIPVPPIEEQRKIVAEYQAVERRIENNRRLIATLESTAQTIYRKMFVDDIDSNNLPEGWEMGKLGDYVNLSQGLQVEIEDQSLQQKVSYNRFIRIIDYTPGTKEPPRFVDIQDKRYYCSEYEVSMIRYGDAGRVCRRLSGIIANNLFKVSPTEYLTNNYIYYYLNNKDNQRIIRGAAASSTMPAITHKTIKDLVCILPPREQLNLFDELIDPIEKDILNHMYESRALNSLLVLLLSTLSKN